MTKPQSYANHIRYYPPHHFVFYPVVLILMAVAIWFSIDDTENRLLWIFALIQLVLTTGVALMLRQHYALTNQNRIVRLELRFRYYVLTNKRLELLESRLSFKQLAALRFASDGELPTLVERTIHENLSPNNIKSQIRTWHPDHMRV